VCVLVCIIAVEKFPHIMLIAQIHAIALLASVQLAAPKSMSHLFLFAVPRNSA